MPKSKEKRANSSEAGILFPSIRQAETYVVAKGLDKIKISYSYRNAT